MKFTQAWQEPQRVYASSGSAYAPAVLLQAARALSRAIAGYLGTALRPPAPAAGEQGRKIIDPLTGLAIPAMFY